MIHAPAGLRRNLGGDSVKCVPKRLPIPSIFVCETRGETTDCNCYSSPEARTSTGRWDFLYILCVNMHVTDTFQMAVKICKSMTRNEENHNRYCYYEVGGLTQTLNVNYFKIFIIS